VTQAKKIIDARLDQPLRLNELADELGMSVSHFRQRFVKELGISPGRYVVSRRVTFAKKLLHDPALSITQIATQLGFSSSQHLATTFRQWTGVSPTAYRAGLKHGQPMA
jgi:AraC family transcriptional regulator